MVDVAKTQLLRVVTLCLLLPVGFALAEEARFADGATGAIEAPLEDIDQASREDGEWIKEKLSIQDPLPGLDQLDVGRFRAQALNDPRVRRLLNADDGGDAHLDEQVRYDNKRVFLFASFSMPAVSLRQMMEEAEAFGIPVVFRGFVENSVFLTREELLRVFGTEDAAKGFSIDPTLFARFDVEAVPVVVALGHELPACDFPGCSGDPAPEHDRISGNIPLTFALETIAEGDGVAAREAKILLQRRLAE